MNVDKQKQALKAVLTDYVINRPSPSRTSLYSMRAEGRLDEIVDTVFDIVAIATIEGRPLTWTCKTIGGKLFRFSNPDTEQTEGKTIKFGSHMIDAMTAANLVKIEKFNVRENDGHATWFITIVDKELKDYILTNKLPLLRLDYGITPWTDHTMELDGHRIDIVKGARGVKLLHNYKQKAMPMVYNTLNRLNETTWNVNKDMFKIIQEGMKFDNKFIHNQISDKQKGVALAAINNAERVSLWLEEVNFKQLVEDKGYEPEAAERFAKANAENYKKRKQFDHLAVVSQWSKHNSTVRTMRVAEEHLTSDINFVYNCDSRGRVYCLQLFLNPQGDDVAKSLLCFANPKPISTWDFYVHLANCAGQDKISYEDRVKWVQAHVDILRLIGSSPWSLEAQEWMLQEGIDRETKTRLQFVAACVELNKLYEHLEAGGEQDNFLCRIPVGYDCTNSGLQVLSVLGRDETVAPYVNITNTPKPGDVYQFIGNFVADEHDVEPLKVFKSGEKIWRKICKRNVMTKPYSATRRGMGDQQWEDRKTYGSEITDNLTPAQCNELGATVYDVCKTKLPRASALMETFQKAVRLNNNPVITWTMPSGFTAFQFKNKMREGKIKCSIGGQDIRLTFYTPTETSNKLKHASAIAPNIVHAYDAYLLTTVVNNMPDEANLAFIHDQFSSDSSHGADIMDYAKLGYEAISSREVLSTILYQVAGQEVELPEAGTWDVSELQEADYIVC